jgi:hypothetical protein
MKNIINKKFGKWTVIDYLGTNKWRPKRHLYKCKCECGNERTIRGDTLTRGVSKSCGCVNRHININNRRWKGYGEISATYWGHIKRDSIRRKKDFNLTIEYIWNLYLKQNRKCALTNLEITFPKRLRDYNGTASLDRIDSSKGYIEGNVQWIDKRINFMKLNLIQAEFVELCKLVSKNSI